ncbi:aminoacyl-tRNA hydrolase [Buchnera aphidicola]|uniref:aminoacyl-tRNA hydrolase n=1 Tax=Buchnera aphidicola TaxID=9 RepID=UPI0034646412
MIVGLSNPLEKYKNTRHNVGSWYIKMLAKNCKAYLTEEKKFLGFTGCIKINHYSIRLLVPNIFMNINGKSIYKMASFYGINLNQILIAHDDLDLKPGIAKLKYSYGHSGHNGLRNTIDTFNEKNSFYRFRIGIGRPLEKEKIAFFVLSYPTNIERLLIKKSILNAVRETFILIKMQDKLKNKSII